MKSFCMNNRTCFVWVLLGLHISACASFSNPEKWNTDLNNRMPVIAIPNENAPLMDHQGQADGLFELQTTNPAIEVSIEQAVMAALEYNQDLTIQRLEPVKAGTFQTIEKAAFDPEFFANAFYSKEDIRLTSDTDEEFTVTEKTKASELGLRKTFSTGTSVQTDIRHESTRLGPSFKEQEARIGLTLTQSLLEGFGPSVNLAGVRQASLDTALSTQELRGFTETLVADTEIAYWQYVLAKQEITIFQQSLDISKKQRDEIEQQISVGLLPQTEAAAARSEVALQEQALINAKSALEEQRLKLIHLISPGKNGQFEVQVNATSSPDIKTLPITDLHNRIRLAQKVRPDLMEARLRLEKNQLETLVTKNGILPRLDLFIALGRTGYGEGFSDTFENIKHDTANDFRIGLSLNHLVGNRESEAKNRLALASKAQAQIAVENLSKLVEMDVRLAVNEVERTRQQIAASRTTRAFQEQTSSAEKDRFDVGDSTSLLVTQAQRDLLITRIAEVEAIVKFRIALVQLHLAEGSLLDLRGIIIDTNDQHGN